MSICENLRYIHTHTHTSPVLVSLFSVQTPGDSIPLRKKVYVAKVTKQSRDETENCSQSRLSEKHDSKFLYSRRCEQDEQREERIRGAVKALRDVSRRNETPVVQAQHTSGIVGLPHSMQ